MEEIKSYVNKDLHGKSYDDFCKSVEMPELTDDFIERLEWALMILSGKYSQIRVSEAQDNYNFNTFDGAWLLEVEKLGSDNKDELGFFKPFTDLQANPDIIPNLNIKTLQLNGYAHLQKFRSLDLKERRHIPLSKIKHVTSRRVSYYDTEKEKWYCYEEGLGYNGAMKIKEYEAIIPAYVSLKPGYEISKPFFYLDKDENGEYKDSTKDLINGINMSYQVALTGYYEWFVYIREDDNGLGVKIPILPEASKEIFALRDVPRGAQRKKAICNFVSEHYRTVGEGRFSEEDRKVLVKKHFRGENKFNWRGLQVNIIPSEYDLNRVKTTKKFIAK